MLETFFLFSLPTHSLTTHAHAQRARARKHTRMQDGAKEQASSVDQRLSRDTGFDKLN